MTNLSVEEAPASYREAWGKTLDTQMELMLGPVQVCLLSHIVTLHQQKGCTHLTLPKKLMAAGEYKNLVSKLSFCQYWSSNWGTTNKLCPKICETEQKYSFPILSSTLYPPLIISLSQVHPPFSPHQLAFFPLETLLRTRPFTASEHLF